MKLPKSLENAVCFAKWCQREQVEPWQAAELCLLARRAASAGVSECNTGQSADKQRTAFELAAAKLGYSTQWNGLGPTLSRDGHEVFLPDVV